DFSEVASGDGDFANEPEGDGSAPRIGFAAGLGKVAASDDTEFGGKRLEEHRHEITEEDDAEERVTKLRAALDVGGPVARVHVTNGDKIAGTGEGEKFAKPGGSRWNLDGAMGFRERRSSGERSRKGGGVYDGVDKFGHVT